MPAQLHRYLHVPQSPNINEPYIILDGGDHMELQKKVNNAIERGYRPLGGVSVDYSGYHENICEMLLFQAMIFEGFKDASRTPI